MYLLDTNVISAIAPRKFLSQAESDVASWVRTTPASLYLSVITASEIEDGISSARRKGASAKAAHLAEWWSEVTHYYGDRILAFDLECATLAGRLLDKARGAGLAPGFEDIAIAATVQTFNLTLLTRNVRHFARLDVKFADPFAVLPD